MPHIESILAVLFAGFALSVTPGPSMLYVLSRTVGQNRAAGFASAFGLALGGVILAIATALGLAALFSTFTWLAPALRYIGSVYLVWLGVTMIWDARKEARSNLRVSDVQDKPFGAIVWQGILVELLNPKTVLFFALFIPPFVSGDVAVSQDSISLQLLILGALVPLTAIPSDMLVVVLGARLADTVNSRRGVREALSWIGGLTLIVIAINLHLGFI